MYATPTLATRFARNTRVLRADHPLTEEQMRAAAPSVFAEGKHGRRPAPVSVRNERRCPAIETSRVYSICLSRHSTARRSPWPGKSRSASAPTL
jgi:hypothetical protein